MVANKTIDELDELVVAAKAINELDEHVVVESCDELNELVVAKGRDELNELVMTKGCAELDELIVAEGRDELNELVVAESCDELNELMVAKSCDELDELVVANKAIDYELGNWNGIWLWEGGLILLQLDLVMLYESTINLNVCPFVLLRHLARVTNWKMQLVFCGLRHSAHTADGEAQLD